MKKIYTIVSLLFVLSACDYTKEERYEFYKLCMANHIKYEGGSIVGQMLVSCACKQWSLRKDIKPKNEEITSRQYNDEKEQCRTKPTKMNFEQKRFCERGFTKVYPSLAETYIMAGMPAWDVNDVGAWNPSIYKRSSNKENVECACMRLSIRDDFIIPVNDKLLAKELNKEIKKCNKK